MLMYLLGHVGVRVLAMLVGADLVLDQCLIVVVEEMGMDVVHLHGLLNGVRGHVEMCGYSVEFVSRLILVEALRFTIVKK